MKYIVKNNLERKVKIIDFKDNPFTYLNKADVMVHTAKFEGLPNVLLEALSLKNLLSQQIAQLDLQKYLVEVKGVI